MLESGLCVCRVEISALLSSVCTTRPASLPSCVAIDRERPGRATNPLQFTRQGLMQAAAPTLALPAAFSLRLLGSRGKGARPRLLLSDGNERRARAAEPLADALERINPRSLPTHRGESLGSDAKSDSTGRECLGRLPASSSVRLSSVRWSALPAA